jgi:hypothetical protein
MGGLAAVAVILGITVLTVGYAVAAKPAKGHHAKCATKASKAKAKYSKRRAKCKNARKLRRGRREGRKTVRPTTRTSATATSGGTTGTATGTTGTAAGMTGTATATTGTTGTTGGTTGTTGTTTSRTTGTTGTTTGTTGKTTGPTTTPERELTPAEAERKAAAEADAQELLGELQLPEGALQVNSNPAGGGWLSGAADVPATGNLVDRHAWWTVPGEPQAVERFIEAHPPGGQQRWIQGTNSGPGGIDFVVGYRWPTVNPVLQNPTLVIQLVALPEGRTGVRADGMVVWLAPFPPADAIPGAAQVLEVVVTRHHETALSVNVTEATKVAAVRSMIDAMPVNAGGVCEGPEVTASAVFTFRAATGGPALAVATVPGEGEVEPGVCLPMRLNLPESGRSVQLEDGPFIREVQALLGVKI